MQGDKESYFKREIHFNSLMHAFWDCSCTQLEIIWRVVHKTAFISVQNDTSIKNVAFILEPCLSFFGF